MIVRNAAQNLHITCGGKYTRTVKLQFWTKTKILYPIVFGQVGQVVAVLCFRF